MNMSIETQKLYASMGIPTWTIFIQHWGVQDVYPTTLSNHALCNTATNFAISMSLVRGSVWAACETKCIKWFWSPYRIWFKQHISSSTKCWTFATWTWGQIKQHILDIYIYIENINSCSVDLHGVQTLENTVYYISVSLYAHKKPTHRLTILRNG